VGAASTFVARGTRIASPGYHAAMPEPFVSLLTDSAWPIRRWRPAGVILRINPDVRLSTSARHCRHCVAHGRRSCGRSAILPRASISRSWTRRWTERRGIALRTGRGDHLVGRTMACCCPPRRLGGSWRHICSRLGLPLAQSATSMPATSSRRRRLSHQGVTLDAFGPALDPLRCALRHRSGIARYLDASIASSTPGQRSLMAEPADLEAAIGECRTATS